MEPNTITLSTSRYDISEKVCLVHNELYIRKTFFESKREQEIFILLDVSRIMYKFVQGHTRMALSIMFLKSFLKKVGRFKETCQVKLILFSGQRNEIVDFEYLTDEFINFLFSKIEYRYSSMTQNSNSITGGILNLRKLISSQKTSNRNFTCVILTPVINILDRSDFELSELRKVVEDKYFKSQFLCVPFFPPSRVQGHDEFFSRMLYTGSIKGHFRIIKNPNDLNSLVADCIEHVFMDNLSAELVYKSPNSGIIEKKIFLKLIKPQQDGTLLFETTNIVPNDWVDSNAGGKLSLRFYYDRNKWSNPHIIREMNMKNAIENILVFVRGVQNFVLQNITTVMDYIHDDGDEDEEMNFEDEFGVSEKNDVDNNDEEKKVVVSERDLVVKLVEEIDELLNEVLLSVYEIRKPAQISILGEMKRLMSEFFLIATTKGTLNKKIAKISSLFTLNSLIFKTYSDMSSGKVVKKFLKSCRHSVRKMERSKSIENLYRGYPQSDHELVEDWYTNFTQNSVCYLLGFDLTRGQRTPSSWSRGMVLEPPDVSEMRIKKIYPKIVTSKEYHLNLLYTLSYCLFKKHDLVCLNYIYQSPIPTFCFPIYLSQEHWKFSRRLNTQLLTFLLTLSITGQKEFISPRKYLKIIPFLLLSKALKDRENDRDSEFFEKVFKNQLETCMKIYTSVLTNKEIGKLNMRFHNYSNDLEVRVKIKNTEAFLAQVFCGIKNRDIVSESMLFRDEFFLFLTVEELRRRQPHSRTNSEKKELVKDLLNVRRTEEVQFYLKFLQTKVTVVDSGVNSFVNVKKHKYYPLWTVVQKFVNLIKNTGAIYYTSKGKSSRVTVYYKSQFFYIDLLWRRGGKMKFFGPPSAVDDVAEFKSPPRRRKKGKRKISGTRRKQKISNSFSEFFLLRKMTDKHRQMAVIFRGKLMIVSAQYPVDLYSSFSEMSSARGNTNLKRCFPMVAKKHNFQIVREAREIIKQQENIYHHHIAPLFFFKEYFVDDFIYVPKKNNFKFLGITDDIALSIIIQNINTEKNKDMLRSVHLGKWLNPFIYARKILSEAYKTLDPRKQIDNMLNKSILPEETKKLNRVLMDEDDEDEISETSSIGGANDEYDIALPSISRRRKMARKKKSRRRKKKKKNKSFVEMSKRKYSPSTYRRKKSGSYLQ